MPTTKRAAKPTTQRATRPTTKPATKPAAKPATTSTAKPAAKPATKSTAKPATKPPARATPKVSPLRAMPVADWVKSRTSGWQSAVVERLIDLTRAVAPDTTVSIKWGQPVFELNGPLAFIRPAKAHVTYGFWRGADLADRDAVLEGGDRMKHLKIIGPDRVDEAQLTAFIRAAAALNRTKGDPTKRIDPRAS